MKPACSAFIIALFVVSTFTVLINQGGLTVEPNTYANASEALGEESGLVAHWNFDEGAGNTAVDSSGSGHNITLFNSPQWIDGKTGKALSFDGVDDYLETPHSSDFDLTELTIALWIKTPSTMSQTWRSLVSKQDGWDRDYCLYAQSDGYPWNGEPKVTALHFSSSRFGASAAILPAPYAPQTWHHVAITVNSTGYHTYYSDGVQFAGYQGTSGNANSSFPVWIGRADNFWNGAADEVRIYSRPLSAEEIRAQAPVSADTPSIGLGEIGTVLVPVIALAIYAATTLLYLRWFYGSNKLFDRYVHPPNMTNSKTKTLLLVVGMLVPSFVIFAALMQAVLQTGEQVNPLGLALAGGFLVPGLLFFAVLLLLLVPGLLILGLMLLGLFWLGWSSILAGLLITVSLHFSAVHAVDALIERIDHAGYTQLASDMRLHQRVGIVAFAVILFKPLMFVNIVRRAKKVGKLGIITSFAPVASWEAGTGRAVVRRVESVTVELPPLSEDSTKRHEKALDARRESSKGLTGEEDDSETGQ